MASCGRMFFVYVFLLSAQTCCSLESSSLFRLANSGHRLTANVISELDTVSLVECSLHCIRRPSECKSINYRATNRRDYSTNCQLINATKTTHSQNMLADKNYDNYELLTQKNSEKEKSPSAKSCDDLYKSGKTTTGVYTIDPDDQGAFDVRCDMESTPGRGWTVFQRRVDGSVDFYRNWADYKNGFGNLSGEFWLGLDKIHRLSAAGQNFLRVDLETFDNQAAHAVYETFSVGNESQAYILNVGNYSGTAGDSLSTHNEMKFSTKDVDNDIRSGDSCAQMRSGAWWFSKCLESHLNGEYLRGNQGQTAGNGVFWFHLKETWFYSAKTAEMKVRPDQN